jgi:hypothetical protein
MINTMFLDGKDNLSSINEKHLKSSKIEIFSWPYALFKGLGSYVFIAFRLDSILNPQKESVPGENCQIGQF